VVIYSLYNYVFALIVGPRNQPVKVIVRETTTIDEFSVEWTPEEIGEWIMVYILVMLL